VDIKGFAERYRVKTKRDSCGDDIVAGKRASHVFDNGDGKWFGILLLLESKMKWTYAKKKLVAAGFTIKQDGDTEGTALFNPGDRQQARLAFRQARIRVRKELSPAQVAVLAKGRVQFAAPVDKGAALPHISDAKAIA
jgi:hypothetical protein